MTKYCAINLNARYRLNFKYSRDDTYVFGKNIFAFLATHIFALTLLYQKQ